MDIQFECIQVGCSAYPRNRTLFFTFSLWNNNNNNKNNNNNDNNNNNNNNKQTVSSSNCVGRGNLLKTFVFICTSQLAKIINFKTFTGLNLQRWTFPI